MAPIILKGYKNRVLIKAITLTPESLSIRSGGDEIVCITAKSDAFKGCDRN